MVYFISFTFILFPPLWFGEDNNKMIVDVPGARGPAGHCRGVLPPVDQHGKHQEEAEQGQGGDQRQGGQPLHTGQPPTGAPRPGLVGGQAGSVCRTSNTGERG